MSSRRPSRIPPRSAVSLALTGASFNLLLSDIEKDFFLLVFGWFFFRFFVRFFPEARGGVSTREKASAEPGFLRGVFGTNTR